MLVDRVNRLGAEVKKGEREKNDRRGRQAALSSESWNRFGKGGARVARGGRGKFLIPIVPFLFFVLRFNISN